MPRQDHSNTCGCKILACPSVAQSWSFLTTLSLRLSLQVASQLVCSACTLAALALHVGILIDMPDIDQELASPTSSRTRSPKTPLKTDPYRFSRRHLPKGIPRDPSRISTDIKAPLKTSRQDSFQRQRHPAPAGPPPSRHRKQPQRHLKHNLEDIHPPETSPLMLIPSRHPSRNIKHITQDNCKYIFSIFR